MVDSGQSAHGLIVMLLNVSGQCCRLLCVCGYCVLDVGFRSVISCSLIVSWMNVNYVIIALWLSYFSG